MKIGYMTNAFGPLVGAGGGVTSVKDIRYVTMTDDEATLEQMHHLSLYLKQYATLFLKSQRISKKDMDLKKHVQTGWILSMIRKSIL